MYKRCDDCYIKKFFKFKFLWNFNLTFKLTTSYTGALTVKRLTADNGKQTTFCKWSMLRNLYRVLKINTPHIFCFVFAMFLWQHKIPKKLYRFRSILVRERGNSESVWSAWYKSFLLLYWNHFLLGLKIQLLWLLLCSSVLQRLQKVKNYNELKQIL